MSIELQQNILIHIKMLKGKTITIGISASIAAFKIPQLIRMLQKKGATVRCMITPHAEKFVSITTLECLTGKPVYRDNCESSNFEHIDLANSTDLFILAPLTANTLSKLSHGIADNTFTSVIMATRKPVLICPAMNDGMWNNAILQKNLTALQKLENFHTLHPDSGELACGTNGPGRLACLDKISIEVEKIFTPQILENKKVLITLGSTREPIDPVRFISNSSSGRMGYALAESAYLMGANVKVISGHTETMSSFPVETFNVNTANEMLEQVQLHFPDCDIFISAAAVSDYKTDISTEKIKSGSSQKIKLRPNPDILKTIAQTKVENQKVIGFALETEDLEKNARQKLKKKNLDYIIANEISNLGSDEGNCIVIGKEKMEELEKQPKRDLAFRIWRSVT